MEWGGAMRFGVFSHHSGNSVVPPHLKSEIEAAIHDAVVKVSRGGAAEIRDLITGNLKKMGWPGEVDVSSRSGITITSMKDSVGLCLQTGNVARIYADLIKLQAMFMDGAIKSAALIVPSQPLARLLGSNLVQAPRLQRELDVFKKAYQVPTIVFALES
jgi:hypothetical protein